jgi:glutamyl-tRNA reductase
VRSETALGRGTLSVARVAVELAARVYGSFESCRALVIGAGETGVLVARHLKELAVAELTFANRTPERARAAAAELGARACGIDALAAEVARADLVVACVESAGAALTPADLDRKLLARRDRPQLLIDLSVPRAVAPELAQLDNILLYDLDDLARVVEENRRGRELATEGTADILVAELHKFLALRTYAAFTPAIEELRRRFDAVRDEVLDAAAGSAASAEQVRLAHELARRLLDVALDQMKDSARRTRTTEALGTEYQRFLDSL